jgi:GDP-mannose transporter
MVRKLCIGAHDSLLTGFSRPTLVCRLNVPMVTVFKNIANIFIVSGDWYIFNQHVSSLTVASLAVMTIGALLTGGSDIAFDVRGYAWMLANCMTTAAYVLKMRHATSTIKLSRFGMVFYNNAIGLALMAPAAALSGEWRAATQSGLDLFSPWSLFINSFAGVVGIGLNFASLWCVGATSATTYAIVGSFNKIPTGIIGYLLFRSPITSQSAFFMFISLAGGFLYSWAKLLESAQERKGKVEEGGQEEDAGLLSDKGGQEEGASFLPSHSTVQPHSPPLRARKPSSEAYPV